MPPRFFYFDMGNVLLSFDYDIAAAKMSAVCGASPEVCRRAGYDNDLHLQFESGKITSAEFHAQFSAATETTSDCEELLHAHSDMFLLRAPTARIVTQLKAVRLRTGLLSNISQDHFDWCHERFGVIRCLFDIFVLSCEVGVMKPAAEIYEVAIKRAGVPAESIFFVDDLEENVAGAKEAGIDAVLFTGPDQLIADLRARGVELNL